MAELTIVFEGEISEEIKQQASEHLKEFSRFAPQWLVGVVVRFNPKAVKRGSVPVTAEILVVDHYREAFLTIRPRWREHTAQIRRETILHEINHAHTAPLHSEVCDIIEELTVDDPVQRAILLKRINKVNETVVQDLTIMQLRNMCGEKGAGGEK